MNLGNLSPTRDMNYISNTVDGFIAAAMTEAAIGKTINLGSGQEISIGDLAQLIAQIVGRPIEIRSEKERQRPEKSEVNQLLADSTLAQELLNWTPIVNLEEGLVRTVDWIRSNLRRYRSNEYTL